MQYLPEMSVNIEIACDETIVSSLNSIKSQDSRDESRFLV